MGIESKTIQILLDRQISVSTAESCTGGLLASQFTAKPGISKIFETGLITYSNDAKIKHLKVNPSTLKRQGAVSRQVCSQMCFNLHKITKSQMTFATTGVAGPKNIYVEQLSFSSRMTRLQIQKATVKECFQMASDIIHGL